MPSDTCPGHGPARLRRPRDPLLTGSRVRAVDRARLVGHLDDAETAVKRKELADLLVTLDLPAIDVSVTDKAKSSFAVNVRALDAIHVATAEILAAEAEGEPLEFWTHDERQATAAMSRGLTVRGWPALS
jgi:hypothetical protein